MRNTYLIYMFFLLYLITNCHADYYINFEPKIQVFLEDKAAYFKQHIDAHWKIESLNNAKDPLDLILIYIGNFIVHNDRDRGDCCEFCYYLKTLHDKKIKFSEENKQEILASIQILVYYFIRDDDYPVSSVGYAKELFENYNYEEMFIFANQEMPLKKVSTCSFL